MSCLEQNEYGMIVGKGTFLKINDKKEMVSMIEQDSLKGRLEEEEKAATVMPETTIQILNLGMVHYTHSHMLLPYYV